VIERAVSANRWSSWVTLVDAPRNGGFAYGNNLGIEKAYEAAAPNYVYLLNPDAQVHPGGIVSLVRFLESRPDVGIAGSSFENLDGSDWPLAFRFPTLISEVTQGLDFSLAARLLRKWEVAQRLDKKSQPIDWICGASMLIRSEVLSVIGGLDENYFLYFEETDFCYRAKRAGFPTWYVPESRVMHIAGQSTKITERDAGPKRLPIYWFESRRRYFVMTFGIARAIVIDFATVIAYSLGMMKRVALRRTNTAIPHLIRDLIRNSAVWPRNRKFPAPKCYLPPGAGSG
jgi:GT2 family glycosyltransferase